MEEIKMTLNEIELNMNEVIEKLEVELSNIRTGRANPSLLDKIQIDYYGASTPLNQISAISVVEGTQLYIKPFDKSSLKDIEHAINASDIGVAPQNDGTGIRLILPTLTEDRRKEVSKDVEKLGETSKVGIRNVRREGNDLVKALELPEDLEISTLDDVQTLTNKSTDKIDEVVKNKIKEVMTI